MSGAVWTSNRKNAIIPSHEGPRGFAAEGKGGHPNMKPTPREPRGNARWLRTYSLMYLAVALPMLALLLVSGKTFIYGGDALYQQYPTLVYTARAVRRLFSGGGFRMVDFSLGQGMDSLNMLAYYGLTDPLQWLAALAPESGLEVYYQALIFLYIYLSGLFFGMYLKRLPGMSGAAVALGAMVYAFCSYQTIGIIKNPYYSAGSLYLPLMLIAVERILSDRRFPMMVLVTALMILANFYLAYQTTLLVILYIVVRLIARLRARGVRKSAGDGFMLLGSYLLGLALSMAVLYPSALGFLDSGRTAGKTGYAESLLHYPLSYYIKLVLFFCAPYDYAGYWTLQSFSPLALAAVLFVFSRGCRLRASAERGTLRQLRVMLAMCAAFLCLPLAGRLFNGMGYPTNRWCYGFAAGVSAATAWGLPRFLKPDYEGRKRVAGILCAWGALMLAYGVLAYFFPALAGESVHYSNERGSRLIGCVPALAGGAAVLAAGAFFLRSDRGFREGNPSATRWLAALTALCFLAYTAGYALNAAVSARFQARGVSARIESEPEAAAARLDGDGLWRADTGMSLDAHAAQLGYRGTGAYLSLLPGWVTEHYRTLSLASLRWPFRVEGLGGDTYLDALAAVKYAVRADVRHPDLLPYGYAPAGEQTMPDGSLVHIYENEYALPAGYVFHSAMSEAEYDAFDPIQKRRALLSCAVLPEGASAYPAYEPARPAETLEWEVVSSDGVTLEGNTLRGREKGMITLRYDARADAETYLYFSGTRVVRVDSGTDLCVAARTDAGVSRAYFIRPEGNFNYEQLGACLCLGYSEGGVKEVTLRFEAEGELQFASLEFLSAPMEDYRAAVQALSAEGWNAEFGLNRAEGDVTLASDGILQFSIPYGRGWTACVDGSEVELLRAGGMYMALPLAAGTHHVALAYETPGLRTGAIVSLAALAVLLVWTFAARRVRRKK